MLELKVLFEFNTNFPELPSLIFYLGEDVEYQYMQTWNRNIANYLHFDIQEFRKYLIFNFNGWTPDGAFGYYPRIYFACRKDAENALQWVESIALMNKLA